MSATVLSTKKLTQPQRSLLINAGLGVVEKDFIQIVPLNFEIPEIPENVIFTSKNAVKAVLANHISEEIKEKRVFCVGDKTAAFLEEEDFEVAEVANYGADLAEIILKKYSQEQFLFFCGKKRHPELPEQLRKNGIVLTEVEVYDTQPAPRKYFRSFDGVLFFSPSGVASFCSENEIGKSIAFCIGKTTASEAKKHTGNIVIANKPSIENVIVQACKIFKTL